MIRISGIEWDTDGEDVDLPTELTVDPSQERIGDPEAELADWLSDRYGWTVKGFSFESAEDLPAPR